MRGAFANSRVALKLRRLRGRFGISAPRVTVRTHVPWHLRALGMVVIGGGALAMAGWIYDAGRRIAGFDSSETAQEIGALRERVETLNAEVAKLRATSNASESSLQIERAALQQVTAQVRVLESENTRLKEENAVFERLAQGEAKDTALSVSRLTVTPDAGNRYRYQFFVAQNGDQRGKEFKGSFQVVVATQSDGGMITHPRSGDPDAGRYAIVFRHFRRIDGAFTVPQGTKVRSVEVRLVQDGSVRATQTVTL